MNKFLDSRLFDVLVGLGYGLFQICKIILYAGMVLLLFTRPGKMN